MHPEQLSEPGVLDGGIQGNTAMGAMPTSHVGINPFPWGPVVGYYQTWPGQSGYLPYAASSPTEHQQDTEGAGMLHAIHNMPESQLQLAQRMVAAIDEALQTPAMYKCRFCAREFKKNSYLS